MAQIRSEVLHRVQDDFVVRLSHCFIVEGHQFLAYALDSIVFRKQEC